MGGTNVPLKVKILCSSERVPIVIVSKKGIKRIMKTNYDFSLVIDSTDPIQII